MYVTQNKVNGEDFEAGTFLSKGTDTTENNEVLEKTLKKKVGKKGCSAVPSVSLSFTGSIDLSVFHRECAPDM
ncbi:hypothetical protein Tco_1012404 [Tanacetum coccineum]